MLRKPPQVINANRRQNQKNGSKEILKKTGELGRFRKLMQEALGRNMGLHGNQKEW